MENPNTLSKKRNLGTSGVYNTWEEFETHFVQDGNASRDYCDDDFDDDLLNLLPQNVQTQIKIQMNAMNLDENNVEQTDFEHVPFTSKLFQKGLDEGDILQLQWMRLDLSGEVDDYSSNAAVYIDNEFVSPLHPAVFHFDPSDIIRNRFVQLPQEHEKVENDKVLENSPRNHTSEESEKLVKHIIETLQSKHSGIPDNIVNLLSNMTSEHLTVELRNAICECDHVKLLEFIRILRDRSQIIMATFADFIIGEALPILLKDPNSTLPVLGEICREAVQMGTFFRQLDNATMRRQILSMKLRDIAPIGVEIELILAETWIDCFKLKQRSN